MYTYEKTDDLVLDVGEDCVVIEQFSICDPDGAVIANVRAAEEAETLLSHLNR